MRKCPFCAEEIQDDAVKCKHCGEWLSNKPSTILTEMMKRKEILDKTGIPDTATKLLKKSSGCIERRWLAGFRSSGGFVFANPR
jgi:hypothetical protein